MSLLKQLYPLRQKPAEFSHRTPQRHQPEQDDYSFYTLSELVTNMFLDQDMDGWYEQCLQCSYSNELNSIPEFNAVS